MHGEYKTPGGKLVVVDFAIADGKFTSVEVSGDFFLYPDEALVAITGSISGMSADLERDAMSNIIRAAIPPNTEVLGTSAEGIAMAISRALADKGGQP